MKTIEVVIGGDGKPKIEANGFTGGSCKTATKPILDALGQKQGDDSETVDKPELHMTEENPCEINLFG